MPDDSDNPKDSPSAPPESLTAPVSPAFTGVSPAFTRNAPTTAPEKIGEGDLRAAARKVILDIMRSIKPPRNSHAKLRAAKMVLSNEFVRELTDEELLGEVRRRTDLRKAAAALTKPPEGEHS